jgi:hypothetical protein
MEGEAMPLGWDSEQRAVVELVEEAMCRNESKRDKLEGYIAETD